MTDPDYLTPVSPDPRLGVDRDARARGRCRRPPAEGLLVAVRLTAMTPAAAAGIRLSDRRSAQAVRPDRRVEGHRPRRRPRREGDADRPERLRQDHAAALRELPRAAEPAGASLSTACGRRAEAGGATSACTLPSAACAPNRHGVPALQSVPAPDGARERHGWPDRRSGGSSRRRQARGRTARQGRPGRQGRPPIPAILRRPAAAGGDRPRAGDGAAS